MARNNKTWARIFAKKPNGATLTLAQVRTLPKTTGPEKIFDAEPGEPLATHQRWYVLKYTPFGLAMHKALASGEAGPL